MLGGVAPGFVGRRGSLTCLPVRIQDCDSSRFSAEHTRFTKVHTTWEVVTLLVLSSLRMVSCNLFVLLSASSVGKYFLAAGVGREVLSIIFVPYEAMSTTPQTFMRIQRCRKLRQKHRVRTLSSASSGDGGLLCRRSLAAVTSADEGLISRGAFICTREVPVGSRHQLRRSFWYHPRRI